MNRNPGLVAAVRSEWIKFRTVRSSFAGIALTLVLTVGLGALISATIRSHWAQRSELRRAIFDPVSTSLSGTLFAQFAVGVIGVLFISSEYASGSIRTTLCAVPHRVRIVAAKLLVLCTALLVTSELACFVSFLVGQEIYAGVVPTASLSNPEVLRAVVLAGVYLTALGAIGLGLGLIFRQSASSISVFASVLLIVPIVTFLLPQSWQNTINRFEPSQLGHAIMSTTTAPYAFSSWVALAVLWGYVVVIMMIGSTMFLARDH